MPTHYVSDDTTFFAENLATEVKRCGGIVEVSSAAGISRQMLKRYIDGIAEPGLTALLKLSSVLGVTVESLCGIVSDSFTTDQFATVPYIDISTLPLSLQKKHQLFADNTIGKFLLSPSHYSDKFMVPFEALKLFYINDNNMSPTLKNGDLTVVSVAPEHQAPCDGIFLLLLNNSIMVRRLQNISPTKVLAMSDNPQFETFQFETDGSVTIFARVMLVISMT